MTISFIDTNVLPITARRQGRKGPSEIPPPPAGAGDGPGRRGNRNCRSPAIRPTPGGQQFAGQIAFPAADPHVYPFDPAHRGQPVDMPAHRLGSAQMAGYPRAEAAGTVGAAAIGIQAGDEAFPAKGRHVEGQRRFEANQENIGACRSRQLTRSIPHRRPLPWLPGSAGREPCRRNRRRSNRRQAASRPCRSPRIRKRTGRNRSAWFRLPHARIRDR